jgi:hypothetical protein
MSTGLKIKRSKNNNNEMNDSFVLIDDVKITSRSLMLKDEELLNDSHIDLALEFFQKCYPQINIIYNFRTAKEIRYRHLTFSLENTENVIFILNTKNHWITITNINCQPSNSDRRSKTSVVHPLTCNENIFVYDSLNNPSYLTELSPIFDLMYKDSIVGLSHVQIPFFTKRWD